MFVNFEPNATKGYVKILLQKFRIDNRSRKPKRVGFDKRGYEIFGIRSCFNFNTANSLALASTSTVISRFFQHAGKSSALM